MRDVLRVDFGDHVAVVQPGITLRELNDALEGTGLRYPVYPGSSRDRLAATSTRMRVGCAPFATA